MSDEVNNAPANSVGESVPFDWRNDPWLGGHLRAANQAKYPPEKLLPYLGQVVAWYPDGHDIWGADPNMYTLMKRIEASGDNPELYVYDYLEPGAVI
jgi:hypothetical protein